MLHAKSTSVPRPAGLHARRLSPMIDLYRKDAFSTRPCPMVARRLRPASPSSLLDRQDRAITSTRPRSVSRHVGRTRRRNHDGRPTRTGGLVKADRIVGGIRRHPSEGAVDRLDQRDASRRVVNARLRQGPATITPRPVDTQMQLLPASPPPSSMFRRGPYHPRPRSRGPVLSTMRGRLAPAGARRSGRSRCWPRRESVV